MAMFPGDVTTHGVVSSEGSVAEGARYANPLMTLADVSTEIGFIAVGPLAEWTFQLRA